MSKSSFEKVISEQGQLIYSNVGDSMYPLIQPRDLLVIKKPKVPLKKYDIPLYKRGNGQYVLHRIVAVRDDGYVTCGDNRSVPEFGVMKKQIIGILTDIIRGGKTLPVDELTRERRLKNAFDLMYLISCDLSSATPDPERIGSMHLTGVLRTAAAQGMLSAAAFALEIVMPLPHELDQVKKKAIRKIALFDIERAKILSEFEKQGIWYCPLKGIILKECYPMIGMREMSDNDILCDPRHMDDIRGITEKLGYKCTAFDMWNHDTYEKPPTLEFEMHRTLFEEDDAPGFSEYFSDIRSKLVGEGCSLKMTDADFYIYMICHMYKHYIHGGTGLRNLADIVAYTERHDLKAFRIYIGAELQKLGVLDFERRMYELAYCVINGDALNKEQEDLLLELESAGTYGNLEIAEYHSMLHSLGGDDSRQSKAKHLIKRIFPDDKYLQKHYPTVHRHRALYPLLILYRPIKGILIRPRSIIKEAKMITGFRKK